MRGSRNHYSLYKTSRTPRMINNAGHTFLKNCCHFCDVSANPFASATPNPVLANQWCCLWMRSMLSIAWGDCILLLFHVHSGDMQSPHAMESMERIQRQHYWFLTPCLRTNGAVSGCAPCFP